MECFISHPDEGGPHPAVIIFMDIWGLREELFDIARRVGREGYYCIVPDMYYRDGGLCFDTRDETGTHLSAERMDPAMLELAVEAGRRVNERGVAMDTGAMLEFTGLDEPARPDPAGVIGFCMGGRLAMFAAGHHGDRLLASASLHGARLVMEEENSPHLLIPEMSGEFYFGYAGKDPFAAPELCSRIAEVMEAADLEYGHCLHEEADHGYALPERDVYDPKAAERSYG